MRSFSPSRPCAHPTRHGIPRSTVLKTTPDTAAECFGSVPSSSLRGRKSAAVCMLYATRHGARCMQFEGLVAQVGAVWAVLFGDAGAILGVCCEEWLVILEAERQRGGMSSEDAVARHLHRRRWHAGRLVTPAQRPHALAMHILPWSTQLARMRLCRLGDLNLRAAHDGVCASALRSP